MAKKATTFRLSEDLRPRLDELAKSEHRTVSSLIGQAVQDFLARRERPSTSSEAIVDEMEPILSAKLRRGYLEVNFEELQALGNESCSLLFKMFVQSDDDCHLQLRTRDKTITFTKKAGRMEVEVPWHTWATLESIRKPIVQRSV